MNRLLTAAGCLAALALGSASHAGEKTGSKGEKATRGVPGATEDYRRQIVSLAAPPLAKNSRTTSSSRCASASTRSLVCCRRHAALEHLRGVEGRQDSPPQGTETLEGFFRATARGEGLTTTPRRSRRRGCRSRRSSSRTASTSLRSARRSALPVTARKSTASCDRAGHRRGRRQRGTSTPL